MSELKKCPFCGGTPKVLQRPDSLDGYFCAISCFCGGYSARAHQAATAKTGAGAYEKATQRWNRRTQPENEPLTLDELRKMRGQMVDVPESDSWVGGSGIIADDRVYNPEDEDGYWPFEYYGEWLAYRRKPERSEK